MQIRMQYFNRDGHEIHIVVGLGMDVSVNFIVSNTWLKGISVVVDYEASQLRVPMIGDTKAVPITYRKPLKKVPATSIVDGSARYSAFMTLPKIDALIAVMTMHDPASP